ncbi:MAG: hypothetical protein GEV11_13600 [Streptosporangiales bacterium]|nr:hypothetical protein [Streptosporangiales bacterium]
MNLMQGLQDAWSSVASFVPKLLAFLVILIVGWIIAKVVKSLVTKGLARVGFDRLLQRGGMSRMLERSAYTGSQLVGLLIYYALGLVILTMAFAVFGPNPISDLLSAVVAWLPRAAVALIIVVVAVAIATAVRNIVSSALSGLSYGPFIGTLASVFIVALGVIAALNQIGVATAVTGPVLIAVLATVGGILVVGVGGGMVRPMQQRWERWLQAAEQETGRVREATSTSYSRGREDAMSAPSAGTTTGTAGTAGRPETAMPEEGSTASRSTGPGPTTPGSDRGYDEPSI